MLSLSSHPPLPPHQPLLFVSVSQLGGSARAHDYFNVQATIDAWWSVDRLSG